MYFLSVINSVLEPEPKAEEPKFNCLLDLEPEPKVKICASGSFLFITDLKKIMVAEEVFVNCYNFIPTSFQGIL
jgi:hypothetical protein